MVATSARERWGPKIQNWVADGREVNRRYHFEWGDTVRTTPKGAVRMGKAPHGIVISEPRQVSWPQD